MEPKLRCSVAVSAGRIVSIYADKNRRNVLQVVACRRFEVDMWMFVVAGGRSLNDTVVLNCPRTVHVQMQDNVLISLFTCARVCLVDFTMYVERCASPSAF